MKELQDFGNAILYISRQTAFDKAMLEEFGVKGI